MQGNSLVLCHAVIDWYAAFSPFAKMFSKLSKTEIIISATFNLSYANALNLVQSKLELSLNVFCTQMDGQTGRFQYIAENFRFAGV